MTELPRLRIYLMHLDEFQRLIDGTHRITNLPFGSKIYKVTDYQQDQCDKTLAVWFSGPEFDELWPRSMVYTDCFQWEEVK